MADYIYIPSGQRVTVADGKVLPPALFTPAAKVEKPKTTRKRATKKEQ